ncbi:MAG: N-acetylmuramoyl-L-alanine amidase [Alphaproteobacteria bacterium]|nr:N-acetylmuramoyl-L-alanine amidase [Alphaproteobacteria bacterium]
MVVQNPARELASPNHDSRQPGQRVDMLLIHYTGMETAEAAFQRLKDPTAKVSAHYVIDEDGQLTRMVDETRRAWHAGVASWGGHTDINGCSIGIELVNPGHEFGLRAFPEAQMVALENLSRRLVTRYSIPKDRVLGHSDVAPIRKADPGEMFDWKRLAAAGVGLWPEHMNTGEWASLHLGDSGAGVMKMQLDLKNFGYEIDVSGSFGAPTTVVVAAFQRHFRPSNVDGIADRETRSMLASVMAARPK